jgi:hypothetical protein
MQVPYAEEPCSDVMLHELQPQARTALMEQDRLLGTIPIRSSGRLIHGYEKLILVDVGGTSK